jgi:hypothetical protein
VSETPYEESLLESLQDFFLLFFPEPSGYYTEAESKENMVYGIDYNLTLYPLQSRLQHICQGQPYARVGLFSRLYPPVSDF